MLLVAFFSERSQKFFEPVFLRIGKFQYKAAVVMFHEGVQCVQAAVVIITAFAP